MLLQPKFVLLYLAIILFEISNAERNYLKGKPNFFKTCSPTSSDLNKCYKKNLEALLQNFKEGIPGLESAGKLEPVKIKKLRIQENQLKIKLKNVNIHGLSATNITKVILNPKDYSLYVRAQIPQLRVEAFYKMDGRILFLPLNGKGKMTVEADKADFSMVVKVKLRHDGNLTFADLQSIHTKVKEIGGFRANLENLFNGNKELEANTNAIFNEYWRDFIEILRPTMEDAIDMVIFGRFKRIFNYIPFNYLVNDLAAP